MLWMCFSYFYIWTPERAKAGKNNAFSLIAPYPEPPNPISSQHHEFWILTESYTVNSPIHFVFWLEWVLSSFGWILRILNTCEYLSYSCRILRSSTTEFCTGTLYPLGTSLEWIWDLFEWAKYMLKIYKWYLIARFSSDAQLLHTERVMGWHAWSLIGAFQSPILSIINSDS